MRRVAPAILRLLSWVICAFLVLSGCSAPVPEDQGPQATVPDTAPPTEPISTVASIEDELPEEILERLRPWTGDFDGMVERRYIRVLVTPNRTAYFLDGAQQKGVTYELLKALEKQINKDLGLRTLRVHMIILPGARDSLLPDLEEGLADIVMANLTVTESRKQHVDFSIPFMRNVDEVVVTGPQAPRLSSLDDLSGREIYVRHSSSFWESLESFNESLRSRGMPETILTPADELLETEDILEMVHAGLIPITVADSYLAEFWAQIYDGITLHRDLTLRTGGQIAIAFRKESPQLRKVLDKFVRKNRKGTLMGNVLLHRYLKDTKWVRGALATEDRRRFDETLAIFRGYAGRYGFEPLMIAAQGYQESRLDQSTRSPAGAIGVMQLLESTARDPNVGIPDIHEIEPNIHAGVKYLRFIIDRYFSDDDIDELNRVLLGFAAYNAGPRRIAQLRSKTTRAGLDPNVWFDNVETIAAREIGRETVQYVSNTYKYYLAYRMIMRREERQEAVPR